MDPGINNGCHGSHYSGDSSMVKMDSEHFSYFVTGTFRDTFKTAAPRCFERQFTAERDIDL
jgi:hypothetical protein